MVKLCQIIYWLSVFEAKISKGAGPCDNLQDTLSKVKLVTSTNIKKFLILVIIAWSFFTKNIKCTLIQI